MIRFLKKLGGLIQRLDKPEVTSHDPASGRIVFMETENYFLELCDLGGQTLVVTFEHAGVPRFRPNGQRRGWGADFLLKRRVSHLSVKPKVVDWYRRHGLIEAFQKLRADGEFDSFTRIITYGASMGGYAALAYSKVLQADCVIAMCPQSSLDPRLTPWETRFKFGKQEDWLGPLADAAKECGCAQKVYCVIDNYFRMDQRHIKRLPQHNLHLINIPFVGHRVAAHLVRMRASSELFDGILHENLDKPRFYKKIRARRDLQQYYNILESKPRVKKSELFKKIVLEHKEKSKLLA